MFDRFDDRSRKVMGLAKAEAQRLNHEYIATEHILLGLVQEGSGVAVNVLKNMSLDLKRIRAEIEKLMKASTTLVTLANLPFTPQAKKVLELAVEEASKFGHNYIGTEHLLLGLIKENEGIAARVLLNLGVKLEDVRDEILEFLGADTRNNPGSDGGNGEGGSGAQGGEARKTPALNAFGRDLTALARGGKLDKVIGRESDIERLLQVLARRTNNNPLLLGESGVGKTAIVEGLAQSIVRGLHAAPLANRRIVQLDLGLMVAGARYRGQLEERIMAVIREVRRAKNIILFVDEIHTMMALDGGSELATQVRPALSHGDLQMIGATTPREYEARIARDEPLARRFYPVRITPTNLSETKQILHGLREKYESHHHVVYLDEALEIAAELAELYLPDQCAPANSIDLLDEAGSRAAYAVRDVVPDDIRELDAQIVCLDAQMEAAVGSQDFELAARSRDRADQLRMEHGEKIRRWKFECAQRAPIKIDADAIMRTLSQFTGVPVGSIEVRKDLPRQHHRDGANVPARGIPAFERLQTSSVLHGDEVVIRRGQGFVLLPHTSEFQEIFDNVVKPAMETNGLEALKADDIYQPGAVLPQVWKNIRTAEVIVADLSGSNANVVYELGLCHGLQRCAILLVRSETELPFNLRNLRYLPYENTAGGAAELRRKLTASIGQFLAAARVTTT